MCAGAEIGAVSQVQSWGGACARGRARGASGGVGTVLRRSVVRNRGWPKIVYPDVRAVAVACGQGSGEGVRGRRSNVKYFDFHEKQVARQLHVSNVA